MFYAIKNWNTPMANISKSTKELKTQNNSFEIKWEGRIIMNFFSTGWN